MSTVIGSVRRLAMAPSLEDVTFVRRGFPVEPSAVTEALESIPQSVICGFEWAIDSRSQWEIERRLALVEPRYRGFAYEGATMALTIRDVMHGARTREFLLGPGQRHIFLTYIGIGFAMARLPRRMWRKVLPDLSGSPYFPTMSWLAVDGFGFDRAYFDVKRYVDRQEAFAPYPWDDNPEYFLRACDHGVGRALWFIHAADVDAVAARVAGFAEHRKRDLWSGVGLAATFAGGAEPDRIARLVDLAGEFRPELGLGSTFAVKARDYAGHMPEFTEGVSRVFTGGMSLKETIALADSTEPDAGVDRAEPTYEVWRQAIRAHFAEAVAPVAE